MSEPEPLPMWRSRPAFTGGEFVFRGGETYSEGEGMAPCFHVDSEEAEPVVAYLNALEERAALAITALERIREEDEVGSWAMKGWAHSALAALKAKEVGQ